MGSIVVGGGGEFRQPMASAAPVKVLTKAGLSYLEDEVDNDGGESAAGARRHGQRTT